VLDVRAATRYLLQYDSWHRYEPPRITRVMPLFGPDGLSRVCGVCGACQSVLNQSAHHSQTLPEVLYRPYPLGAKALTGAVPRCPSAPVLCRGKTPCQVLQRCWPRGVNSSPQGTHGVLPEGRCSALSRVVAGDLLQQGGVVGADSVHARAVERTHNLAPFFVPAHDAEAMPAHPSEPRLR